MGWRNKRLNPPKLRKPSPPNESRPRRRGDSGRRPFPRRSRNLEVCGPGISDGTAGTRNLIAKSTKIAEKCNSSSIRDLLPGKDYLLVRSILFDKTPKANWPVAWHQDRTIAVKERHEVAGYGPWSLKDGAVHVQPPSELLSQVITIRVHLDDCPENNGALRIIPRSHLNGILKKEKLSSWTERPAITLSCKAGSAILMKPLILHSSPRSVFPTHRRVVHLEFAPKGSLEPPLEWMEN